MTAPRSDGWQISPCPGAQALGHGGAAPGSPWAWPALLSLLALVAFVLSRTALASSPANVLQISGYATPLEERSTSQRHNARLAAEALNGYTIAPGAMFSFNRVVKPWTIEQGYVRAPVSFDGELVLAYGGGICQTSTTLYNAALLAGLPILERHPHVFAPKYVTPGRDAAVAQYAVDLRFRNPYPWPIQIRASVHGDRVEVRIVGRERPATGVDVGTSVISISPPGQTVRLAAAGDGASRPVLLNAGSTGFRVVTTRVVYRDGKEIRRETLSDDTYEAADRVVQLSP